MLDIWDKKLKKDGKRAKKATRGAASKHSSTHNVPVDLSAAIGPQKLSHWYSQIAQADSYKEFLETRFACIDEVTVPAGKSVSKKSSPL